MSYIHSAIKRRERKKIPKQTDITGLWSPNICLVEHSNHAVLKQKWLKGVLVKLNVCICSVYIHLWYLVCVYVFCLTGVKKKKKYFLTM